MKNNHIKICLWLIVIYVILITGCSSVPKTHPGYFRSPSIRGEQNVWVKENVPTSNGVVYSQCISLNSQLAIFTVGILDNSVLGQIFLLVPVGERMLPYGVGAQIELKFNNRRYKARIAQANQNNVIIVLEKPFRVIKTLQENSGRFLLEFALTPYIYRINISGNLPDF